MVDIPPQNVGVKAPGNPMRIRPISCCCLKGNSIEDLTHMALSELAKARVASHDVDTILLMSYLQNHLITRQLTKGGLHG